MLVSCVALYMILSAERSVAGTTSAPALMEDMGFSAAFNVQLHVPALKEADVRTVLTAQKAFSSTDVSSVLSLQCHAPLKALLSSARIAHGRVINVYG